LVGERLQTGRIGTDPAEDLRKSMSMTVGATRETACRHGSPGATSRRTCARPMTPVMIPMTLVTTSSLGNSAIRRSPFWRSPRDGRFSLFRLRGTGAQVRLGRTTPFERFNEYRDRGPGNGAENLFLGFKVEVEDRF